MGGRDEKPAPKAEKKVVRKGKRIRKGRKHVSVKVYKFYDLSKGIQRKKKPCPRCGPGTFLADHKNRIYCGRCGYTEFLKV